MVTVSDIGKWLERKYLEWQIEEGARRPLKEFAIHMKKSQSYISMVMNGERTPSQEVAYQLAEITGDYEILDIMGFVRPDPRLAQLQARYDAAVKAGAPVGELMDVIDEWLIEQGVERID